MATAHPPLNVELGGIVKAVPSGDSLVLLKPGPSVGGPPPELRVFLSSVRAPSLARGDDPSSRDEPCAFAAREALRSALIGKRVIFVLEYVVQALGNRLMASVKLAPEAPNGASSTTVPSAGEPLAGGELGLAVGEDVAVMLTKAGLVRVRRPGDQSEQRAKAYEVLCAAEDSAIASKVGLHADDGGVSITPKRDLTASPMDPNAVASACRGKVFKGICEYVSNGSAMKVFLHDLPGAPPGDRILTLCLSGVQCPGFRRAEGEETAKPMPYALNARFTTEMRMLHRDVVVSIEGADRNGILFATVTDPKSSSYIGEDLLRAGYAKTVGWSIELTAKAPSLRAAERAARDSQAGVWKGFVMQKTSNSEDFVGRCVEVVSGDMIAVVPLEDLSTAVEPKRYSLASVRAARAEPTRDRSILAPGPAADAKEALRKKLIGRNVRVQVAYVREPSEMSVRKDPMSFAVVGRDGDAKNPDVAVPMISDGLLSVVRHRGDEERSPNYEAYLEKEKAAREAQRGVHKTTDPTKAADLIRINNLTGPDAKKRSKEVLPGLMRGNPHSGLIEYVSSGSRFRIYLPKDAMLITVGLRAVRTPQATRRSYLPDGTARVESTGEPYGDESLAFSRQNFMQRDVEVYLSAVDRAGAFLGSVVMVSPKGERQDIGKALLANGLGYLHESFDPREAGGGGLEEAEKNARASKTGLWKDYTEPAAAERVNANANGAGMASKVITGSVSEVAFGGRLFVQPIESSQHTIASVEAGLAGLGLDGESGIPAASIKPGETVAAKFSVDGLWYRARVLARSEGGARVRFLDYGNEEDVSASDIRRPTGAVGFMAKPPAAIEVSMADIVVPEANDSFALDAGGYIRELVYGKTVKVDVKSSDGPSRVVGTVMYSETPVGAQSAAVGGSSSSSVPNAPAMLNLTEQLLKSGLVRIVRKSDRASRETYARLAEFEKVGQATRDFLWTYGDAYESDCDDEEDVKERNRSRRGGP